MSNTLYQGIGVFHLEDGGDYAGEFRQGIKHGRGRETWPNGKVRYVGTYKDGLPHGRGTFRGDTGITSYQGSYHYGSKHGTGLYTNWTGQMKKTVWCNNEQIWSEPRIYLNDTWHMSRPCSLVNGFVHVKYQDGAKYIGQIQNGVPHGKGKYATADERMQFKGEFECGELMSGTIAYPDGSVEHVEWNRDTEPIVEASDDESAKDANPVYKFRACELDACCICQDSIVSGQPVVITECMHVFHKDCCMRWLQQRKSCPVCQGSLSSCSIVEEDRPKVKSFLVRVVEYVMADPTPERKDPDTFIQSLAMFLYMAIYIAMDDFWQVEDPIAWLHLKTFAVVLLVVAAASVSEKQCN